MSHLLYGFRKNGQGRIEHKLFDSDVLRTEGKAQGWYDSPNKIPDAEKLLAAESQRAAENAKTVGQRASTAGPIYGDVKRKPGRPRKNP